MYTLARFGAVPIRSPRSSRAGSIAASPYLDATPAMCQVAPLIASGLHCGFDVGGELDDLFGVAPLIASGLHCGIRSGRGVQRPEAGRPAHRERAPLRRADLSQVRRWRTVAPLIASGLHCGLPVTSRG